MKQFCMKIDIISQGRENVLFLLFNMAMLREKECNWFRSQNPVGSLR